MRTKSASTSTHFVQLRSSDEVLEQRVIAKSRAATSKVSNVDTLRRMLERRDVSTPIHSDDLRVDNSEIPADVVCQMIAEASRLKHRELPA